MPKKETKILFYLIPMGEGIAHPYCQKCTSEIMMRSNNEKYTDDNFKEFHHLNPKVSELHCVQCNKLLWKKWIYRLKEGKTMGDNELIAYNIVTEKQKKKNKKPKKLRKYRMERKRNIIEE